MTEALEATSAYFYPTCFIREKVVLPAVSSRPGTATSPIETPKARAITRNTYSTAARAKISDAVHDCTERVGIDRYGDSGYKFGKYKNCVITQDRKKGKGKPSPRLHTFGNSGSSKIEDYTSKAGFPFVKGS